MSLPPGEEPTTRDIRKKRPTFSKWRTRAPAGRGTPGPAGAYSCPGAGASTPLEPSTGGGANNARHPQKKAHKCGVLAKWRTRALAGRSTPGPAGEPVHHWSRPRPPKLPIILKWRTRTLRAGRPGTPGRRAGWCSPTPPGPGGLVGPPCHPLGNHHLRDDSPRTRKDGKTIHNPEVAGSPPAEPHLARGHPGIPPLERPGCNFLPTWAWLVIAPSPHRMLLLF